MTCPNSPGPTTDTVHGLCRFRLPGSRQLKVVAVRIGERAHGHPAASGFIGFGDDLGAQCLDAFELAVHVARGEVEHDAPGLRVLALDLAVRPDRQAPVADTE